VLYKDSLDRPDGPKYTQEGVMPGARREAQVPGSNNLCRRFQLALFRLSILGIAVVLLSSLAHAEDIGPFHYKCDDGRSFTITFVKAEGESSPMTARLALPKSKDVIILTNKGGASGIHYANDRYAYDEWHGNVSFRDISKKGKGKSAQGVSCHEVKK